MNADDPFGRSDPLGAAREVVSRMNHGIAEMERDLREDLAQFEHDHRLRVEARWRRFHAATRDVRAQREQILKTMAEAVGLEPVVIPIRKEGIL